MDGKGESLDIGRLASILTSSACRLPPSAANPLSASVLVLNRFYMAVHVINVRRAFGLLFRELAEVIHVEEGQYANYNFDSWREISELRATFKEPHEDWISSRSISRSRCRGSFACWASTAAQADHSLQPPQHLRPRRQPLPVLRQAVSTSELSLDHVVPRAAAATTCWENIVCACVTCNVRKGGRTPQEANMELIRQPVSPSAARCWP